MDLREWRVAKKGVKSWRRERGFVRFIGRGNEECNEQMTVEFFGSKKRLLFEKAIASKQKIFVLRPLKFRLILN